ncbi:hypothetical protein O3G_MSEX000179 [Manduca sexta]|nr:hypothetical protein O3G_MSEX000179 [Manduca sexta]
MANNTVKLNILQWNAQSIKPKVISFFEILRQEKVHVASLSETWLEPDSQFNLSGYDIYRTDRVDSYGGVALAVHKSIKSQRSPIHMRNSGIEVVCVQLFNCYPIEYIVAVYCPSRIITSYQDWEHLFSSWSAKTLILGDFNAHHISWSYKTDPRGNLIHDSLLESNFITLNDGSHTRIRLVNTILQQSSPDISLVSLDIASKFDWNVLNESLNSDHLLIKISTIAVSHFPPVVKRNFRKADWGSYSKYLEAKLRDLCLPDNPQEAYDLFLYIVNEAANKFIPLLKFNQNLTSKFSPKPYWTAILSRAVASRRLALASFRRNPTPHNLGILKNKINLAQRLIRQAKKEDWQNFCTSVNESTTSSDMWRKMKWLKGYSSSRRFVDPECSKALLRSLTPDFVSPLPPIIVNNNPALECEISIQELEKCIKPKDTSPGYDDFSYSMIKNLPDVAKRVLLKLFNKLLFNSFVPYQWRDICITPIPKPGRDSNVFSSLRPISLMSCLCKIFHYILYRRLEWFLEKHNIFSSNMVGFRKCRSCADSLSCLICTVQTGFSENCSTIGCFLDIENAYNNVDNTALIQTLDKLQVGTMICNYLWNFLRERVLKIKIGNGYISRSSGRGLAQGDPLSPLLFNVVTSDICKILPNDINISQYADDFVIYTLCRSSHEGQVKIQASLDLVSKMLNRVGLDISPSKSKICIFSRGFRRQVIDIRLNDTPLVLVDTVRYLGMWLDKGLRWNKHIDQMCKKVAKFINIFRILVGPGWGIHPVHLRRLYIALVRSRMDFASFLFDNSADTHLVKLDRLQNICLRLIGGFVKSTPIHVMESELFLAPLFVRRRYLAGKFYLKSKTYKFPIIKILELLKTQCNNFYWRRKKKPLLVIVCEMLGREIFYCSSDLTMYSMNTWVSNMDLSSYVKPTLEHIDKPKQNYNITNLKTLCCNSLNDKYYDFYPIYTDGSRFKNNSGAAFLDLTSNTFCKFKILCSKLSIMHIELIAIAEALGYIESLNGERFVIITDSKSALLHLLKCTSSFRGLPIAYSIIKSIYNIVGINKLVVLQWIPSHIGLEGNDVVDKLAKEAASDGIPFSCLPWHTELLPIIREKCLEFWSEYFDKRSLSKGIWYKVIQPSLPRSFWFGVSGISRHEVVTALRLRAGHVPLNSFAFMMRKINSPNCSVCGVVEDVYHILFECSLTETQRCQAFGDKNYNLGFYNSILAIPLSKEARMLYKLIITGLRLREH